MGEHEETGAVGSFGTSSVAFEVARAQTRWTPWSSLVVLFAGLGAVGLGILDSAPELMVLGGIVVLIAVLWLAGSLRSYRDARRLERRAAERSGKAADRPDGR